MPRDYTKNLSNYTLLGTNIINPRLAGASGLTFFAWTQLDTVDTGDQGHNRILVILGSGVAAFLLVNIDAQTTPGSNLVRVEAKPTTGVAQIARTTASVVADGTTWQAIGAVADFGAGTLTPYLTGTGNQVAATYGSTTYVAGTPTIPDQLGGWVDGGNVLRQYDGRLAHAALWRAPLDSVDMLYLALGVSPLDIRPNDLVAYWPLLGIHSPEIDYGPYNMTVTITGSVPAYTTSDAPMIPPLLEESGFDSLDPITTTVYDEAVSMPLTAGFALSGGLDLQGSINLPAIVGMAAVGDRITSEAIVLGTNLDFLLQTTADLSVSVSLPADVDIAIEGGLNLNESVQIDTDVDMQVAEGGGSIYSESLTFGVTLDFASSSAGSVYQDQIGLSADFDFLVADSGTWNVDITLLIHPDMVVDDFKTGESVGGSEQLTAMRRRR